MTYLTNCLGEDDFMIGGSFSLADIALTSPFVNFALAGETIDQNRWPAIANYVERVHGLPSYRPIVEADLSGPFARFKPQK